MYNVHFWINFYLVNYNYLILTILVAIFITTTYFFFENIKEIITDYIYDITSYNKLFNFVYMICVFSFICVFLFYGLI